MLLTEVEENKHARDVERSLEYLRHERAYSSLAKSVYWPKWDSPWWHVTLLWEMGHAKRIPPGILDVIVKGLNAKRDDVCHCQIGIIFQVLEGAGRDPDLDLPWARPWFLEHQLADGGLNCNTEDCRKPEPKSSVLSTLPPMEAVLLATPRPHTEAETRFLDAGAAYLIRKKLLRRETSGEPIDRDWWRPCFPRFYHYDALRGLEFLTAWAERRGRPLPKAAIAEALEAVERHAEGGMVRAKRVAYAGEKTLALQPSGTWEKEPAAVFDLLAAVSGVNRPSPYLTRRWRTVRERIGRMGLS